MRSPSAARDPLAARAEELVGRIKEVAAKPKPRAVHQLRTTIRRVETLISASEAEPSRAARKLQKQLDRIRQRAGKVRDADVHLTALATLARMSNPESFAEIRSALEKSRMKREKKLRRVLDDERDRGIVKRLRRVVGRAVGDVTVLVGDVARVLVRFDHALTAATPLGATSLHAFRIETKRLRYLAEVAPGPEAARAVKQLKRVQDAIGAWHDWLTLAERAARALGDEPSAPMLAVIRTRADAQLAKALTVTADVGRRLQSLRPKAQRKGVHPVTTATPVMPQSAGASA
ncbi:MAG: CHAD domain-containing protein [Candidatus Binatia bacterium]